VTEVSDGFGIVFPFLPQGLDDFVDKIVPEPHQRGLFRKKYEGRTLGENLGLQRARNRFFEPVDAVSAAEQPFSAYLPLPGISGAKTTRNRGRFSNNPA